MIMVPIAGFDDLATDTRYLDELQEAYPDLDLARELKRMRAWLDANPRHRYRNYKRFIVNWLNKEVRHTKRTGRLEVKRKYANIAERDLKGNPGADRAQGHGPVAVPAVRGDAAHQDPKRSGRSLRSVSR